MTEKEKPIFEVYLNGERKMWTVDQSCIPSPSLIAELKKLGYKIKMGKEKQC